MLQVLQYQKDGEIVIEDLPAPLCPDNGILVRTAFSLISAGTEKTSVSNTQSSLLQRAKKQPEQAKLVLDNLKKEGIISTFKKVQSKLDSYKTLGYSASGIVIESRCDEFFPGDRVACAGAGYATHSEIIAIPKNLAAKIPENVSFEDAAYTTVATIAMQGVRQADVRLGENVAVIGLGLIGQITVQLLKASGCRVCGLDINESLFESAKKYGCDECYPSSKEYISGIKAFTKGLGYDSAIITASTDSNEPMELALNLTRKKGRIVIVGGVPMNVSRSPFYEKELELTISCSYGPGRYDPNYEEHGIDYPAAYVRWTENRNMMAVLELVSQKRLDVSSMTTHIIDVTEAEKAYDMITGKVKDDYLGILLKYPENQNSIQRITYPSSKTNPAGIVKIGFIGAGQFAQSYLLPNLNLPDVQLIGVSTSTPVNAHTAAKKYSFNFATTDSIELLKNNDINTIFCATKHDSHGKYVLEGIRNHKTVFVEKPLAVSPEELTMIDEAVAQFDGRVMVGYNRRFSKPFLILKDFFSKRTEPMSILYRINAGKLPRNHWVYLPEQGAGRIIGEVCHFIDCCVYLTGALPDKVYAESLSSSNSEVFNHDSVLITIKFNDGSAANIQYLANGDSTIAKEYCEVFCEGTVGVMNNFTSLELIMGGKKKIHKLDGKKGHKEEVESFINSMKEGKPIPIPYQQLRAVSLASFAANESLTTGNPVII